MYRSRTPSYFNGVVLMLVISCFFESASGQILTSSNLPLVVINTDTKIIVDDPKITVDMGIIYNGEGVRNNVTDPFNNFNGPVAIEIRGSSSQMFPKKQYGFKLLDEIGSGRDTTLLGLPTGEDWILFAPYNDKSLMRDVLAYKMGRDLERYAPRARYCELIINGEYQGIYVLIEKIKRDKNRVDIKKLTPADSSGNAVTGGYILKIDKLTGGSDPGWTSHYAPYASDNQHVITFLYEYPASDKITNAQKVYIQNFMDNFEKTLNDENFNDRVDGYARYIDVDSFVDYFIMSEVTKNVDAYRLSTFFHKQRDSEGGKLVMGPIWDFNLGFGNADYCTTGSPSGLVLDFNFICPTDFWLIPFWWKRLLQDPAFDRKVMDRWATLRSGKFRTETIHSYIDSTASVLSEEAAPRNFQRWPVLGTYVWPNYYVGPSFEDEVNWMKEWITARMLWLDGSFGGLTTAAEESVEFRKMKIEPIPNPFVDNFEFKYAIDRPGNVQISVYDRVGGTIESVEITHSTKGTYSNTFGNSLPPGMYYCISTFEGSRTGIFKLIKR
jgi:hypothetical protein